MMRRICFVLLIVLGFINPIYSQKKVPINTTIISKDSSLTVKLIKRFKNKKNEQYSKNDVYDIDVYSPKSVNILNSKGKFYINSLEGFSTIVYDLNTFAKLKVIKHEFNSKNKYLFLDTNYFDYKFKSRTKNINIFKGKPVEGCFSHDGKYLWVSYYRRSYDNNAIDPSALCIIDTDKDSIVRVMPAAILPKVIQYSKETDRIIVTNWGDNTVSLIDVNSNDFTEFKYIKNVIVDKKYEVKTDKNLLIDRDKFCGDCLRGTAFTPDGEYAIIGKSMNNSLAALNILEGKYLGNIIGMKPSIRHIVVKDEYIYLASTQSGHIQRAQISQLIDSVKKGTFIFDKWEDIYLGKGIRTIKITEDGKYLFAAVNDESKIVVVDLTKYSAVCSIDADSFPVGIDVSGNGKYVIVTSQAKNGIGGNSVMIYEVVYNR